MDTDQLLALQCYQDSVLHAFGLYCWRYSAGMELLSSTCPNPVLLDQIFSISGCKALVLKSLLAENVPVVVSDTVMLHWLAVPLTQQGKLAAVFLMGPTLSSYMTEAAILEGISRISQSVSFRQPLQLSMKELPVLTHTMLLHEGVMLNYLVNRTRIQESEISVRTLFQPAELSNAQQDENIPPASVLHAFEEEYFGAIAEGNIHYRHNAQAFTEQKFLYEVGVRDPVRQAKNQMLLKANFCSRAAIRGGLTPEVAYSICDQYSELIERCGSAEQIYEYGRQLYQEFLHRVHTLKTAGGQSRDINFCVAYLEDHLTEPVDYNRLSADLGYNRQYLSAKFRRETGCTMGQYLKRRRIERAKALLRDTQRDIAGIAQSLQFSSPSHFSHIFHEATGLTPGEYRNQKPSGRPEETP